MTLDYTPRRQNAGASIVDPNSARVLCLTLPVSLLGRFHRVIE